MSERLCSIERTSLLKATAHSFEKLDELLILLGICAMYLMVHFRSLSERHKLEKTQKSSVSAYLQKFGERNSRFSLALKIFLACF